MLHFEHNLWNAIRCFKSKNTGGYRKMRKELIRFEPLVNAYMVMHEGEFYAVDKEKINELLSGIGSYRIVESDEYPPHAYSMPLKVQIQATKKCNLRCVTCAVAKDETRDRLSFQNLVEIISLLADCGVLNLEWSGGEPFLRKNFPDLVEHASKVGLSQNILTNGTLLTEENVEIVRKNFFRMQISLDGVGDTFNQIVGRNLWDRFAKAVSLAVKKEAKDIIAATVLQKSNVESIDDIINFCSEIGIKRLRISLQVPIGRSKNITWENYSAIIDLFRQRWPGLKNLATEKNVEADCFLEKEKCADDNVDDVGYLVSPGGYSFLYIDADGDIYPFPFLASSELKLGNILKDDLKKIWLHSNVLEHLRNQNYRNTGCGNCRLECSFAERSLVYAFTGKLDGPALSHRECQKERR